MLRGRFSFEPTSGLDGSSLTCPISSLFGAPAAGRLPVSFCKLEGPHETTHIPCPLGYLYLAVLISGDSRVNVRASPSESLRGKVR